MTQFGEWLKQIVVIVMLSAIADLLLPTKAMQKYVRAVFGLAIIAAMVQPITPFFRYNWADQLSNAVSSELENEASLPSQLSSNDASQAYDKTFRKQEEKVADVTLEDSVLAELDPRLRHYVSSLKVTNALTPERLTVTLVTSGADKRTIDSIDAQIEQILNISEQHIAVENGGG